MERLEIQDTGTTVPLKEVGVVTVATGGSDMDFGAVTVTETSMVVVGV